MKKSIILLAGLGLFGLGFVARDLPWSKLNPIVTAHAEDRYIYCYPQVPHGYRFNLHTRILRDVGIDSIGLSDVGDQTCAEFPRALTSEELVALAALMADNPEYPPAATGTKYVALDLYENRSILATKFNKTFWLWWEESVPGSGSFDRVLIYFDDVLSQGQKNTVATEYSKLLSLIP